jgi:hypothetical protein
MEFLKLPALSGVACAVFFLIGSAAQAQSSIGSAHEMELRLESLTQELNAQRALLAHLESFRQQYFEQRALLQSLERQVTQQQLDLADLRGVASWDKLASQRGAGKVAESLLMAQATTSDVRPVGQAPGADSRPPEVAPLFEQPGVLTPKGSYVLEPSFQYGYSSSNRVSLVGYTIIPAILVGLIDVREIKRNTVSGALSARMGVTNRLELEIRAPYVYRSDANVTRPYGGAASDVSVFEASGMSLGDVELGARYQFNEGGVDKPFFIGAARFKSRTGKDPFEVVTSCNTSCSSGTDPTQGLPIELPTGSGFYSAQLGLTVLYPSDPAVFFGSVTYMHNFSRDNVMRNILNGQVESLGTISPGDVYGFNFGMGLALNEKSSFSIGYDHSSVGPTAKDGSTVPGSVRVQLASLLLGYSYRLTPKTSLNVSVGAGLTRDTPDVSLTVRLPVTF